MINFFSSILSSTSTFFFYFYTLKNLNEIKKENTNAKDKVKNRAGRLLSRNKAINYINKL